MSIEQKALLDALKERSSTRVSPNSVVFSEPSGERPLFTDTSNSGLLGSGMLRGRHIVALKGETYGDTDISLDNPDTRARVDRARSVIPEDKAELYADPKKMKAFFDTFAARIHKQDVVGDYFPDVLLLQRQQSAIMSQAKEAVIGEVAASEIVALEQARTQQNSSDWARRSESGAVTNEAVIAIEERNEEIDRAILEIKKQAALEVLGEEAAQVEFDARDGLINGPVSESDMEERVVAHLMQAAAEKKLPEVEAVMRAEAEAKGEEFKTHAELKAEEDAAWAQKHATQDDFADAIRDGNPDCSEYASLTAVSLAESGIPNLRVMGHTMSDSDFPIVGAHAYNVILDQDGENVIGVFEGTATSGTFRQVMNDVSLEEFKAGKTLVTHSAEAGWSTYGTGHPAEGKPLNGWTDDNKLVSNVIEAHDVALIAQAKQDYIRELDPQLMADQMIETYRQYGDDIKVQGWIDMARDDGNPAFAQAAQLLHDYQGSPEDLRGQLTQMIAESNGRASAENNYDQAVTPEALAGLEDGASIEYAKKIKVILDNVNSADLDNLQQQYPWLAEVRSVMADVNISYTDALVNSDDATKDAYFRVADIVRDNDIGVQDMQNLSANLPASAQFDYKYGM